MPTINFVRALIPLLIFINPKSAIPSSSYSDIDNDALLALGGTVFLRAEPLEICGVYNGRKKRYIVDRDERRKCCRDKICLSVMGEILDKDPKGKCPGDTVLDPKEGPQKTLRKKTYINITSRIQASKQA